MLQLGKVLGLTTRHNAALAVHPKSGEIAYAAGAVVVVYSARKNRQTKHYVAQAALACCAFSHDGVLLAAGERGPAALVWVWNTASGLVLASLKAHRGGVGSLSFSPTEATTFVTVGFKEDGKLTVWDVAGAEHGTAARVLGRGGLGAGKHGSYKVYAACWSSDGLTVVTCGERGVVFYDFPEGCNAEELRAGHAATRLASLESRTFRDVVVVDDRAFTVTDRGELAVFSVSKRLLERYLSLEAEGAFAVSVVGGQVAVGCADGVARLFEADDLKYAETLPRPMALGKLNATTQTPDGADAANAALSPDRFPAALAVRFAKEAASTRVVCVYADKSLFVWEVLDEPRGAIGKYRSFLHHADGIRDLQCLSSRAVGETDAPPFPDGAVVTCSADGSIRCFDLEAGTANGRGLTKLRQRARRNIYSREMLQAARVPDFDTNSAARQQARELPDLEAAPDVGAKAADGTAAPRTLAVRPGFGEIAVGDGRGRVLVYDASSMETSHQIKAHSSQVLDAQYSTTGLLATAGKDGLIHVFDADAGYALLQTLENHGTASVTAVRFSTEGSKLFSCGGDATLAFCSVEARGSDRLVRRYRTVRVQGDATLGAVDATSKHVVTAGRRLDIWSMAGKRRSSNNIVTKASPELEVHKFAINEAGTYVAACCLDRTVRIFDFYSGALLATAAGHGDVVHCVRFSACGTKLLTAGADACIMSWNIAPELCKVAAERLAEIDARKTCAPSPEKKARPEQDLPASRAASPANSPARLPPDFSPSAPVPAWAATKPARASVAGEKYAPRGKWAEFAAGEPTPDDDLADMVEGGDDVIVCDVDDEEDDDVAALKLPAAAKCDDRDALSLSASFRGLRQERAALKARHKGQETTAALENMRARLTAMGILKEDAAEAPVSVLFKAESPSKDEDAKAAAEPAPADEAAAVEEEAFDAEPALEPEAFFSEAARAEPDAAEAPQRRAFADCRAEAPPATPRPSADHPPPPPLLRETRTPFAGALGAAERPHLASLETQTPPRPGTAVRTKDAYDAALGELRAAAQRALELYAELESVPPATPLLHRADASADASAGDVLSEYRESFAGINEHLSRALPAEAFPNRAADRRLDAVNASAFPAWPPSRPGTAPAPPDLHAHIAPYLEHYSELLLEHMEKKMLDRSASR
ncbi:quinon protein alcohol dehydrogenase-like superfamily [Pelagophyceae sp. CCMP2097]|nr:quinon protein alcohol dehydrogenase-like superfamily [Pelagophyceae sp. CCMP2097]